jgi:hypothetical protein
MEHLSVDPLLGRLLSLPTSIRIGWKGLSATNTVTFLPLDPGVFRMSPGTNVIKLFTAVSYDFS